MSDQVNPNTDVPRTKKSADRRQYELEVLHELMEPEKFRTPYEPHRRFSKSFCDKGPSRTKQSFKDECDINRIMKRWQKTAVLEHVRDGMPSYGDFTNATDYKTAADQVKAANEAFMQMPANVRQRVDNSPAKFLDFIGDPENRSELVELGLLEADRVNSPVSGGSPTPPAPEAGTPSGAGPGDPTPVSS